MTTEERLARALTRTAGREVQVHGVEKVTGGYSRVMHRVTVTIDGKRRQLVWRSDPPAEAEIVKTDRAREHAILNALDGAAGAPRVFYFDQDGHELGSVGMILDFIEGDQLMSLLARTPESEWPEFVRRVGQLAATIHAVDVDLAANALGAPSSWNAYMDDCIGQWRSLADEMVEPSPLMHYIAEWLDKNRPPEVPLTLLHGDLQTPNVIVNGDETYAIDWEFSRVGDPREDLGYFAALAAISPPDPIAGDVSALCAAYLSRSPLTAAEVNPLTVAYFSILPFGPMVRQFVSQVAELVADRNKSLKTANLALVLTGMAEGWVGLIQQLDAAMAGVTAS